MRDITQLGGVYYVFPAAASKRFEHSIGVAHLAQTLIRQLKKAQPELGITLQDELCVELAGLIHDLGHGPFSHLFDATVLPSLGAVGFHHEHASVALFDLLYAEHNLEGVFERYGLYSEHRQFIKQLVLGSAEEARGIPGFNWVSTEPSRRYLYDIVANKRNGVDTDKLDYFARDCHMLHLNSSFDAQRLMRNARVLPVRRVVDGAEVEATEICFNHKSAFDLYDFFHTRHSLYKRAYFHKVSAAVDLMVAEALILANDYFTVPGDGGRPTKMSECAKDMHAYWRITEWIVRHIQHSTIPELAPSRALLERLWTRDLFVCAGEILVDKAQLESQGKSASLKSVEIVKQLHELRINECAEITESQSNAGAELWTDAELNALKTIGENDIFVTVIKLGYGMKGKNPVSDGTTFFLPSKDGSGKVEIGQVLQDSISRLIPKEYEEMYVRVFARHRHQKTVLKKIFDKWGEQLCCASVSSSASTSQLSPHKGTKGESSSGSLSGLMGAFSVDADDAE